MSMIYQKEPAEVSKAIQSGLKKMARRGAFTTPLLRKGVIDKAEEPIPVRALPVYNIGLNDLAKGKDSSAAIQTGWRYTIQQNNEIVAHAATTIDEKGAHHFAAINEGPIVRGMSKAIEFAEKQDVIKKGKYEVRLLIVPALYVAALWLVDKVANVDYAIPIEPSQPPFIVNEIIPFQDFLEILQNKAKSVLAEERDEAIIGGS